MSLVPLMTIQSVENSSGSNGGNVAPRVWLGNSRPVIALACTRGGTHFNFCSSVPKGIISEPKVLPR